MAVNPPQPRGDGLITVLEKGHTLMGVGWTDKRRKHGKPKGRIPVTPELRSALRAEGATARTEAFVWAREQMIGRHPRMFQTTDQVMARLSADNSSRGRRLREEFTELRESWPGL